MAAGGPGCAPDLIVQSEDWPHGLRCGNCKRVLHNGDKYAERWTGMVCEMPAVLIVCRPCEERHTIRAEG